MKLQELLTGVEVTAMTADPATEIQNIRYDSRAVEPGDLFVAVAGYRADGHRFIRQAAERGAAAVLCQNAPGEGGPPYILTPDSRLALARVSAAFFGHPADSLTLIGVTGTNGKTTTTTLIRHILTAVRGGPAGLIGTTGNWIGDTFLPAERTTPESFELQALLRRMADAGCSHAVMEVSSHALALHRVAGLRFSAGVFTNLTQDHLDFHGTMLDYAAAKARLFSACDAAAVNVDDAWSPYMASKARCPVLSYGTGGGELRAEEIYPAPDGVSFTAVMGGRRVPVRLGIPGTFSVSNALAALAAAVLSDISLPDAAAALRTAPGVRGRMEVVPSPADCTVIIDYAHTPDALEKLLKSLRAVGTGRLVAVFGCGGDRDRAKRPLMGRAAAENADFLIITSDNPRSEDPDAIIRDILEGLPAGTPREVIPDRVGAITWALQNRRPGDVIVLAGKGHETYQEIGGVKRPLDERTVVAETLARKKGGGAL